MSILAALVAIAIALAVGFAVGCRHRKRGATPSATAARCRSAQRSADAAAEPAAIAAAAERRADARRASRRAIAERARIIRSFEAETAMLRRSSSRATRRSCSSRISPRTAAASTASSRPRAARRARYRQLVVDLENNAPPPFFGVGAPDDLKLIVGVGPVLERMLQQLGITTYRQIARWTERDIDEFDAKLPEFPGRIRRDAWVTQARALHASKYGAPPSARDR